MWSVCAHVRSIRIGHFSSAILLLNGIIDGQAWTMNNMSFWLRARFRRTSIIQCIIPFREVNEWKKSACMFFLTIHYMSSGVVITCAICWIVNSDSIVTDAACLCYHHCTSAPERVQIRWLRALLFRYTPEQWTHLQSNKSKPKKMKTKVLKTIKISRVRRIVQECFNPKRTRI